MSEQIKTEDRLHSSEDQSLEQPTTSEQQPTTTEPEEQWESTASSTSKATEQDAPAEEDSRLQRLNRYRKEMALSITIPDMWGKESLLKDWTGFPSAVERSLSPEGLSSARQALVVYHQPGKH